MGHSDDENKEEGELDDSSSGGESDNSEKKVILIESSASERENSGIDVDLDSYAGKHSGIGVGCDWGIGGRYLRSFQILCKP